MNSGSPTPKQRRRLEIFAVGALFVLSTGCAGSSQLSAACPPDAARTSVPDDASPSSLTVCSPAAVTGSRSMTAFAGVQQTASGTRTVGVPRGFLIALIVLIVLMAA